MIEFQGQEQFAKETSSLFIDLGNAGFLAGCLPDAQVTEATADRATWQIRPKLSFVSGSIETTATVADRSGTTVRYRMQSKSMGAGSTMEAELRCEPTATGTMVFWSGKVTSLSGLLKLAPKSLIQGTAQKVIADVWAAIHAKVGC